LIPWEIQSINTLPDNFLWEKDKSSILVVAPGLYCIYFGFYSRKKPTVQLLVNGDPVLSAVNSASYVIHHTSGKMKDVNINRHPAGNITGLSMLDFLLLPARARLSKFSPIFFIFLRFYLQWRCWKRRVLQFEKIMRI